MMKKLTKKPMKAKIFRLRLTVSEELEEKEEFIFEAQTSESDNSTWVIPEDNKTVSIDKVFRRIKALTFS